MTDNLQEKLPKQIADTVISALDGKNALDISLLAVGKQTVLADWFVLATGTSNTHVRALTDEAVFRVREQLGVDPLRIEGECSSSWTLIDFGSVVVHVFTREGREFYKLDRLWADTGAEKVKI